MVVVVYDGGGGVPERWDSVTKCSFRKASWSGV